MDGISYAAAVADMVFFSAECHYLFPWIRIRTHLMAVKKRTSVVVNSRKKCLSLARYRVNEFFTSLFEKMRGF